MSMKGDDEEIFFLNLSKVYVITVFRRWIKYELDYIKRVLVLWLLTRAFQ